jgi:hypothetical protein
MVPVTSYSSFKDSLSFWGMGKYRRKELERYMVGVITLCAYQGHVLRSKRSIFCSLE